MGEGQRQQAQDDRRRDANGQKTPLAPFRFRFTVKDLLPRAVVAPMRKLATDFLKLRTRDKLLLVHVAGGDTPTEAADRIAATVAEIENLLAAPAADREKTIAAVALEVETALAPFAQIVAQISPARRGIFTAYIDGHAKYAATDAATARSTTCQHAIQQIRKRGNRANLYNAGEIVVAKPTGTKPKNRRIARTVSGCHCCDRGVGPHCLNCRRISRDDIRIERAPHNLRNELNEAPAPAEAGREPAQATNLAPEIEDTLRRFLSTFAAMSPLAILYTAHRATRRGDAFAEYLRQFVEDMSVAEIDKGTGIAHRYGRATIRSAWNAMVRANPNWQVFRTWERGHSRWDAKTGGESGRRIEAAAEIEAEVAAPESEDAPPTDRTFNRRDDIGADRDEETTRYFYPDDGTDW